MGAHPQLPPTAVDDPGQSWSGRWEQRPRGHPVGRQSTKRDPRYLGRPLAWSAGLRAPGTCCSGLRTATRPMGSELGPLPASASEQIATRCHGARHRRCSAAPTRVIERIAPLGHWRQWSNFPTSSALRRRARHNTCTDICRPAHAESQFRAWNDFPKIVRI
jgi:hypothetical protein